MDNESITLLYKLWAIEIESLERQLKVLEHLTDKYTQEACSVMRGKISAFNICLSDLPTLSGE